MRFKEKVMDLFDLDGNTLDEGIQALREAIEQFKQHYPDADNFRFSNEPGDCDVCENDFPSLVCDREETEQEALDRARYEIRKEKQDRERYEELKKRFESKESR